MTQFQERTTPRYPRRNAAEDRAWRHLYRNAGDPDAASEIVHHLEADAEAQRLHLALYLRCRETLRRHAARRARMSRIAALARGLYSVVVLRPLGALNTPAEIRLQGAGGDEVRALSQTLQAIERAAEHANAPQLRAYIGHINAARLMLEADDRAYAEGLLLKLDRLLREQLLDTTLVESVTIVPFPPSRAALGQDGERSRTTVSSAA